MYHMGLAEMLAPLFLCLSIVGYCMLNNEVMTIEYGIGMRF